MTRWIDKLSDEAWRTRLGRRFEAATDEVFHVLRWTVIVGLARFLSVKSPALWFDVIHWVTSAMLFGHLASRFLLRPEVPFFARLDRPWKRRVQTAVNYTLCLLAFLLVIWVVNRLVDGIAVHRFGATAG